MKVVGREEEKLWGGVRRGVNEWVGNYGEVLGAASMNASEWVGQGDAICGSR